MCVKVCFTLMTKVYDGCITLKNYLHICFCNYFSGDMYWSYQHFHWILSSMHIELSFLYAYFANHAFKLQKLTLRRKIYDGFIILMDFFMQIMVLQLFLIPLYHIYVLTDNTVSHFPWGITQCHNNRHRPDDFCPWRWFGTYQKSKSMYTCTCSEFSQNLWDHHFNVQKLKINRNAGISNGQVRLGHS